MEYRQTIFQENVHFLGSPKTQPLAAEPGSDKNYNDRWYRVFASSGAEESHRQCVVSNLRCVYIDQCVLPLSEPRHDKTNKMIVRPGWSESSLGAQSFCWFCHEAFHLSRIHLGRLSALSSYQGQYPFCTLLWLYKTVYQDVSFVFLFCICTMSSAKRKLVISRILILKCPYCYPVPHIW